jgi:hypothetical protein
VVTAARRSEADRSHHCVRAWYQHILGCGCSPRHTEMLCVRSAASSAAVEAQRVQRGRTRGGAARCRSLCGTCALFFFVCERYPSHKFFSVEGQHSQTRNRQTLPSHRCPDRRRRPRVGIFVRRVGLLHGTSWRQHIWHRSLVGAWALAWRRQRESLRILHTTRTLLWRAAREWPTMRPLLAATTNLALHQSSQKIPRSIRPRWPTRTNDRRSDCYRFACSMAGFTSNWVSSLRP